MNLSDREIDSNTADGPNQSSTPLKKAELSKDSQPEEIDELTATSSELEELYPGYKKNFFALGFFQIVLRIGWIFKTESIIMPAILDSISGAGWVRGILPSLNRFGQSVPPLIAARSVKHAASKNRIVIVCSVLMGVCFLALSCFWAIGGGTASWLTYVFLILYGLFFCAVGVNQIAFSTLIGKLIPVKRRGRLVAFANLVGAIVSVTIAIMLLRMWLREDGGDFALLFLFSGTLFVLGGLSLFMVNEPKDELPAPDRQTIWDKFRAVYRTVREDRDFAKLCVIGACFGSSLILFPHYQNIARERLDLDFKELLTWVVIQNLGTGFLSLPAGILADRYGNRFVLRIVLLMLIAGPILALTLSYFYDLGRWLFPIVFFLIGATPITFKIVNNYTLELTQKINHPRYLSTIAIAYAIPAILLSPLAGLAFDLLGVEAVFFFVVSIIGFGWLMTFSVREPRFSKKNS